MRKLSLFLAFFLPLSFLLPMTGSYWKSIDTNIFLYLNHSVALHPLLRLFWAFSNIKITDLFGAFFILGCFLLYIYEARGSDRKQRYAELIYTLIWFELTIFFSKQFYNPISCYFSLSRHSPSVVFDHAYYLSALVSWTKIKDRSISCFPGDHATITLLWCCFLWVFAGWKRGIVVSIVSTLFILPRLISGAHWVSDIFIGSLPIVICALLIATHPLVKSIGLHFIYRCVGFMPKGEPNVSTSY